MDEGAQAKAALELGLWDAAKWLITVLWLGILVLAKRTWTQQEGRLAALEAACETEHKLRQDELAKHESADHATHNEIRKELADELKEVNTKIDIYNERAAVRYDALREQMATQHGAITTRVDKILTLMAGDKS